MFVKKNQSTPKQMAYAQRILGGRGESKKQIALNSGYSPTSSKSVVSHIESKRGFHNAMTKLALESNNVALAAIHEFKSRGFKDFSNKELTNALSAIGTAWQKFNAQPKEKDMSPGGNRLRTIVMNQIENQNIQTSENSLKKDIAESIPGETEEVVEEEIKPEEEVEWVIEEEVIKETKLEEVMKEIVMDVDDPMDF